MLRSLEVPALILLLTVAGLACVEADEPEPSASSLRASEVQTLTLDIAVPEGLTPDELTGIASAAEALAGGDAAGARVEAKQDVEGGAMSLTIQVWGSGLGAPEAIVEALRAEHPALVSAEIGTEVQAGAPADEPLISPDPDETPDQIRARIIEELEAQGVTGEISVEVIDEGEGRRRVEVHVEDTNTSE